MNSQDEQLQRHNTLVMIAQTIVGQIGAINMMRLGVPRKSIRALDNAEGRSGGVRFNFTGCPKIRLGTVSIDLMPDDTYTLSIRTIMGRELHKFDHVLCEDLAVLLNDVIG